MARSFNPRAEVFDQLGVLKGRFTLNSRERRFRRIFIYSANRPPSTVPAITTVRSVTLSGRRTNTMVGLTRYSRVRYFLLSKPRQTITFYSSLIGALSDPAAAAVVAHELAHAWLNEHVQPEESRKREEEADALAREWGFAPELEALDKEAYTVQ